MDDNIEAISSDMTGSTRAGEPLVETKGDSQSTVGAVKPRQSFLDLPYDIRHTIYDEFFHFDQLDKLPQLFRLSKHIYAEACAALHRKHTFVLVSFYWCRQDKVNFYEKIALSLEYDLGASGKLKRGVNMSTREQDLSATMFRHLDLHLTVAVKSRLHERLMSRQLHVMLLGLENLQALLCAASAVTPLWRDGPKLRDFNYVFHYESPGTGVAHDGAAYNEHFNKIKITQCFKEHWPQLSNIRFRGVSLALGLSLTAVHSRSAEELLVSWKTTYDSGIAHWRKLDFEAARLCMRQVYDDIGTAYALNNIQDLSQDDYLRVCTAIEFFYPASLVASAGLCLHMSILRYHEDPPRFVHLLMCSTRYADMSWQCLDELFSEEDDGYSDLLYGLRVQPLNHGLRGAARLYAQLSEMEQMRFES